LELFVISATLSPAVNLYSGNGRPSGTLSKMGAAHETPPEELARLKIDGGGFTLLATLQVEADRLTLVQSLEPCALDRRDMDEHVLGSVGRLNETETLLGVKPFYCT
jgi:hypothetical protein